MKTRNISMQPGRDAMRHTLYIVLLLPLLLLTSCRDADDKLPGGGSTKLVTVSRLSVSIEGMQSADEETSTTTRSAETRSARTAETRSADADGIDAKGYLGSEKKKFVEGDVLHFKVALTWDDLYDDIYQISNATLQKDGTTWLFDKPLILPQDATKTYNMQVFYNGKQDKYHFYNYNTTDKNDAAHGNYYAGYEDAQLGTTDASSGYTSYPDLLKASGFSINGGWDNYYGITLTPDGTLTLKLEHQNTLVRISSITNRLDTEVKTIEATVWDRRQADIRYILLSPSASSASPTAENNAAAYDAIIGNIDEQTLPFLKSFTVTFTDGRTAVIPVPDGYGGYGGIDGCPGRSLEYRQDYSSGRSFTYRLLLLPGSLSAVPDENGTAFKKRRDPAVPAGYIPIYTAEDLRKIGTNQPAIVNGYLYTNASSAILANEAMTDPIYNSQYSAYTDSGCSTDGAGGGTIDITSDGSTDVGPLFFSLSARYILMNDIDLTPASGAIGTDLVGIESVPKKELWTPIGRFESNTYFSGRFNGNGFTIRGMTICSDALYCGLFGSTDGAVIYNVHMQDARVKNTHTRYDAPPTGSLVAKNLFSTLSLCSANGCAVQTGQNASHVGGLVGNNFYSTLTRCHAAACTLFSGQSRYAGGLVGDNNEGILASCYTAGCTSTASQYIGGLAGRNDGSIYGCYATYSQAPSRVFGSLVGLNNGAIASCYAINAPNSTPGLVDGNNGTITACVSPFKTPGNNQDGSHNGAPGYADGNGQDYGGGSYWNVISTPGADGTTTYTGGYAPLTDATTLATLNGYIDINGKSPFTDKGNLAAVRTILVNNTDQDLIGIDVGGGEDSDGSILGSLDKIPPGGLYVLKREWTALGVWGGSTAPTSDKNPTASLPRIKWEYEGGRGNERMKE